MKRILFIVLTSLTLGYVTFCGLLFFFQWSFIYFPTAAPIYSDPASVEFRIDGETLRVWTRNTESADAVIYFGGNAEDVSFTFREFSERLKNQNLYFVNYRGYGGSSGSPSEAALFADALAVYDLVYERHPNISVVGRSLGSGVAAYLATARNVDKLVLVTPYDSIENVAKKQFPMFPISLLLQDKFDSVARVQSIKAKTLIIVAENDEVIPRENSDVLIAEFPSDQVSVNIIKGTNHNSIGISPSYSDLVMGFLGAG